MKLLNQREASDMQVFDIGRFIAEKIEDSVKDKRKTVKQDEFRELLDLFDKYQEEEYKLMSDDEKQQMLQIQHEAIIGVPHSIDYIKDRISDFIQRENKSQISYPVYYKDLKDAIFHEKFGFGPLSTWENYRNSQSAQVIGTDIYYTINGKKVLQEEKFDSIERVMDICRSLTMKNSTARLNEREPSLEIDMYDGTRVSISIPPRTQVPVLTFRRFVIEEFSIEHQAKMNTIPKEAIPLFRALARTRANIIISGPVRSGKSTMLKTMFAERDEGDTTICIEKHHELYLRRDFPNRAIIEFQANEDELLHEVMPQSLRMDGSYYIIGEIRGIEADVYLSGCERGTSGCMATHHTTYAINVPGLIARHVVDAYPGRSYRQELLRAAENIDFVITMEELKDTSKKVTSIQEVYLDPYTHEISTTLIMEYDFETDDWYYNCEINDMLLKKLKKYDREYAQILMDTLSTLARKKPIKGSTKQIALESKGLL